MLRAKDDLLRLRKLSDKDWFILFVGDDVVAKCISKLH